MKKIITCILYSLGFVAIGIGIPYIIYSSDQSNYEFVELLSDIPRNQTIQMDSPYYLFDVKNKTTSVYNQRSLDLTKTYLRYHVVFSTEDVFAVTNPMEIQIYAKIVGEPIVKDVIFMIHSPSLNYSLINDENFDRIIDAYRGESIFDLEPQSYEKCLDMDYFFFNRTPDEQPVQGFDCFFDSEPFTYPVTGKISLVPFVRDQDNSIYKIDIAKNIIDVSPAYTKLQAETNRITIETIEKIARNNDLVLGLTLIIIAGIPLTIGTMIILFERKEHERLEKKLEEVGEKINNIDKNTTNAENKIVDVWKRIYGIFQDYKK